MRRLFLLDRQGCLSYFVLVLAGWFAGAAAAQAPVRYALRGATVHTLVGEPLDKATVLIEEGLIARVGEKVSLPRGTEVIRAEGLHVYPGMLDAFSYLGLVEVSAVPATVDLGEKGDFNPHLDAATGVHPASEHIPVARANGVTQALVVPGPAAGFAARGAGAAGQPVMIGQASLIELNGWTTAEMLLGSGVALVVDWPTIEFRAREEGEQRPEDEPATFAEAQRRYEERVREIESWLEAARHYRQAKEADALERVDAKLEALVPVVEGKKKILVVARRARTIRNAVAFAEKHGLRMILGGGDEAWKEAPLLAGKNIPVILGPTQTLPAEEDDPYDKPFTQPRELHEADVRFAFGTFSSWNSRLVPYEAGHAEGFGLPHEEALRAVSRYPAEILGFGDRLGTIEEGKIANLIVTDGDPLEIRTQVKHVFIGGVPAPLGNKHLRLYETYRARP